MKGFFTAWQFLTVLPFRGGADVAAAVRWCPMVGLGLGALLILADYLLLPVMPPLTRTVLVVALLVVLTGALHLDGLADSADGLLVHRDPAGRLAIMKDPRTGGFGVAAVVVVILLKVAAVAELDGPLRWPALFVVPALARWVIVAQGASLPSARPGEGLGASWKRGATLWAVVIATATALIPTLWLAGWQGGVLAATAAVLALLIGQLAVARIGGLTGDVLGATVEVAETGCWVVACALAAAV